MTPTLVICPGRLDEKGKLKMVCKEDCSHSVPHDRHDACGICLDFCAGCISVDLPEEPEEENRLCYTNSCPKWFDDICRNSTGCADCSTRTTDLPIGNFDIENAVEIENGPKIVHGGVTFESSDGEPEKDDDCLCDKEPVVWVVVAGRGELNWGCPDCRKIYGNWKPIHLRKKKECWLCEGTGSVMMDRQTGAMFAKEPTINWLEKDCYEHQCPNCDDGPEPLVDIDVAKEGKYSLPDKSIHPLKCLKCKVVYDSDIVILPDRCPSCGYEPLEDLADNVGVPPV